MIFADAITVKMQLDAVRGPQGEQGIPGPVGPAGPRGIQGERGVRGESAYEGAIRLNLTNLSEEEWLREYDTKRDNAIRAIEDAGSRAESDVQQVSASAISDIEAKKNAALAEIPADYTQLAADVSRLKDIKADAIIDTSAKAASHTLHAQDAPMRVTLCGQTYQSGSGDPSPDNVRPISGVDIARVHCGGKNLIDDSKKFKSGSTIYFGAETSDYVHALSAGTYKLSVVLDDGGLIPLYAADITGELSFNRGSAGPANVLTFTLPRPALMRFWTYKASLTVENILTVQVTIGKDVTAYEPFNANVIDMTNALNSEAMFGDGTAMDMVENDVLSGCDVRLDFSDSTGWVTTSTDGVLRHTLEKPIDMNGTETVFSNLFTTMNVKAAAESVTNKLSYYHTGTSIHVRIPGINTLEQLSAYLAANPLTVFYRSTSYAPDKDLRVCKVTRRWKAVTLDGGSDEKWTRYEPGSAGEAGYHIQLSGVKNTPLIYCDKFCYKRNFVGGQSFIANSAINDCAALTGSDAFYIRLNIQYDEFRAILESGIRVVYQLATPEVYYIDPHEFRKPANIMPVTITGSGETAVEYSCDTKSYIDRKFDALAAALIGG